jgi:polysaccharide biosynthesis/export protein
LNQFTRFSKDLNGTDGARALEKYTYQNLTLFQISFYKLNSLIIKRKTNLTIKVMKQKPILLLFLTMVFLSSSCVSRKQLTYLQYGTNGALPIQESQVPVTPSAYRLMPYDILYIRVITPDPQWSEIFNTMPVGQGGALTGESAALIGYSVDENGNIEIPYVGQIAVANKTVLETKVVLDSIFKNYLNDAAITVRLVNNYISIIGEVIAPGRYPLTKDRLNIFEALSLAGDLNAFSNRQKLQLIRPGEFGPLVKEFSLLDRSIMNSEFYYVMPNDIIYAQPVSRRTLEINSSVTQLILGSLTTILSTITTLYVIFNYGNN